MISSGINRAWDKLSNQAKTQQPKLETTSGRDGLSKHSTRQETGISFLEIRTQHQERSKRLGWGCSALRFHSHPHKLHQAWLNPIFLFFFFTFFPSFFLLFAPSFPFLGLPAAVGASARVRLTTPSVSAFQGQKKPRFEGIFTWDSTRRKFWSLAWGYWEKSN